MVGVGLMALVGVRGAPGPRPGASPSACAGPCGRPGSTSVRAPASSWPWPTGAGSRRRSSRCGIRWPAPSAPGCAWLPCGPARSARPRTACPPAVAASSASARSRRCVRIRSGWPAAASPSAGPSRSSCTRRVDRITSPPGGKEQPTAVRNRQMVQASRRDSFRGLREYVAGDDLRLVHWRSSARTGELVVRQDEQPRPQATAVVLDLRRTAHAGLSLERAVSVAASVVLAGRRAGQEVRARHDRRHGDAAAARRERGVGARVPRRGPPLDRRLPARHAVRRHRRRSAPARSSS